ncbi:sensor histidine kinase [Belliella sp. DSM 107340]|uniref:histidine kinase n=1 Tax=Belliella calami TaxID=2923436 RepID=A0ABS9ULT2_9BACT|nr:sensor histidine kinase [Belliella calami]MCH7397579.1 sensor histidine kinase [Belliella calami]
MITTSLKSNTIFTAIFCIKLLYSTLSIAQNQIVDSLIPAFEVENNLQKRFELIKNILSNLDQDYDRSRVIEYYKAGLQIAEETENFLEFGKWSIELYEIYRLDPNDENEALSLMKQAKSHIQEVHDNRVRGIIYLKLAAAHYSKTEFTKAIEAYTMAELEFSENDSIYLADAIFFRAQAKDYKGELIGSMNDYQKAKIIYENLNDIDYVNYVNNGIAVLYSKYNIFQEAEKIRIGLAENYLKQGNLNDWAITLYNQSRDYVKQNKQEDSFAALKKVHGKINNDSTIDPDIRTIVNLSLSNYYSQKNDKEMQTKHFEEAQLLVKNQLESSSFIRLPLLKSRILIYENQNNLNRAYELAKEYTTQAVDAANMDQIIDAYLIESRISEKHGDYKNAFESLAKYQNFTDSLFQANQANTFSYFQTLYETEKKERDLLLKTQELAEIKAKTIKKIRTIVIISVLILTVMLLWFLIKNLKAAKKAKIQQEKFSRDLLISQENERKRISKDLHDGLGQSLLLIKNKIILNQDNSTSTLLDNAIEELRGISRSLHPFQLEELGVSGAIQNLLNQIDEETAIFVSSEIDNIDNLFDKDQQLHIYRIVQESFNNIIKHAKASAVRVMLTKKEKEILLTIQDNGIGFDFSEKYNDFKSLGLKTLKERTATLGGSMKVDSEMQKGTIFSFLITI